MYFFFKNIFYFFLAFLSYFFNHIIERFFQSKKKFPNRSRAIQTAVAEKLKKIHATRLASECAKLDSAYEQAMADEGLGEELEDWPEY